MLCKNCDYFHVVQEPWKDMDFGMARCDRYDLIVEFLSYKKFEWLSCVDDEVKKNDRDK